MNLVQIGEYEASHNLRQMAEDCDFIMEYSEKDIGPDMIWRTAASAPDRYDNLYGRSFLVIIDEFQNTAAYVYRDRTCETALDDSIPGKWHRLSESKLAPMLVIGSYVGWLPARLEEPLSHRTGKTRKGQEVPPGTGEPSDRKDGRIPADDRIQKQKAIPPSRYFANVADGATLNVVDVKLRTTFQRPDGKAMEIDVLAESDCGRVLALEVKKTQAPVGPETVKDFLEKLEAFAALRPGNRLVPAFFLHRRIHGTRR